MLPKQQKTQKEGSISLNSSQQQLISDESSRHIELSEQSKSSKKSVESIDQDKNSQQLDRSHSNCSSISAANQISTPRNELSASQIPQPSSAEQLGLIKINQLQVQSTQRYLQAERTQKKIGSHKSNYSDSMESQNESDAESKLKKLDEEDKDFLVPQQAKGNMLTQSAPRKSMARQSLLFNQIILLPNSNINKQPQQKEVSKYSLIGTIQLAVHVRRFINKIADAAKGRTQQAKLSSAQLKAINDKSCARYEDFLDDDTAIESAEKGHQTVKNQLGVSLHKKTFCQIQLQLLWRLWIVIPVIQPNHKLKLFFDCWQSFLIMLRMFVTTIKLSFFLSDIRDSVNLLSDTWLILLIISFFAEIIVTFKTGYYKSGIIITDQQQIAQEYVRQQLFSDMLAQIPLIVAFFVTDNSSLSIIIFSYVLEFLIFAKWVSLNIMMQRLEHIVTEKASVAPYWPLVQLTLVILFIGHIVGLMYHLIAVMQIQLWDEQNTWLQFTGILDSSWPQRYLQAVYWTGCIMVGITLYNPITTVEIIFALCAYLSMALVFGYMLNTIGDIMDDIGRQKKLLKLERERVNRFMNYRKIPDRLKERVVSYLEYLQLQELEKNRHEEELILERLSEQLRCEVLIAINQHNIGKFACLARENELLHFSEATLNETLLVIHEQMHSAGEIVFRLGECSDEELRLYVVEEGEIEIYYQREEGAREIVVATIARGQTFGELEFFTGKARAVNARATESCSLLSIRRSDFLQILRKRTEDYQLFCMLGDLAQQQTLLGGVTLIGGIQSQVPVQQNAIEEKNNKQQQQQQLVPVLRCYLCQSSAHLAHDCPQSHFTPNKKQLIYDYNRYGINIRRKYKRWEERNPNALTIIEDVQDGVEEVFDWEDEVYFAAMDLRQQLAVMDGLQQQAGGEGEKVEKPTFERYNSKKSVRRVSCESMGFDEDIRSEISQTALDLPSSANRRRLSFTSRKSLSRVKDSEMEAIAVPGTAGGEQKRDNPRRGSILSNIIYQAGNFAGGIQAGNIRRRAPTGFAIDEEEDPSKEQDNMHGEGERNMFNAQPSLKHKRRDNRLTSMINVQKIAANKVLHNLNDNIAAHKKEATNTSPAEAKSSTAQKFGLLELGHENDNDVEWDLKFFDKMKLWKIYLPHNNYDICMPAGRIDSEESNNRNETGLDGKKALKSSLGAGLGVPKGASLSAHQRGSFIASKDSMRRDSQILQQNGTEVAVPQAAKPGPNMGKRLSLDALNVAHLQFKRNSGTFQLQDFQAQLAQKVQGRNPDSSNADEAVVNEQQKMLSENNTQVIAEYNQDIAVQLQDEASETVQIDQEMIAEELQEDAFQEEVDAQEESDLSEEIKIDPKNMRRHSAMEKMLSNQIQDSPAKKEQKNGLQIGPIDPAVKKMRSQSVSAENTANLIQMLVGKKEEKVRNIYAIRNANKQKQFKKKKTQQGLQNNFKIQEELEEDSPPNSESEISNLQKLQKNLIGQRNSSSKFNKPESVICNDVSRYFSSMNNDLDQNKVNILQND